MSDLNPDTTPSDDTNLDPAQQEHEHPGGEAAENEGTAATDQDDESDDTDADDSDIDESGQPEDVKSVMRKERQAAKEARRTAKQHQRDAEQARKELARYKAKHGDLDPEPADPAEERIQKANDRIRRLQVKTAAKGLFRDENDVFAYLDMSEFEVNDDGEVDEAAVKDAIEDLLERKPYLAAEAQSKAQRFQGTADQGTPEQSADRQWTQADIDKATPNEIEAARKKGLLREVMRGR